LGFGWTMNKGVDPSATVLDIMKEQMVQVCKEFLFSKPKTWRHFGLQLVFFLSGLTFIFALFLMTWSILFRLRMRKTKGKRREYPALEKGAYDVVIVGVSEWGISLFVLLFIV